MRAILLATVAAILVQPIVFFLLFLTPALIDGAHITQSDLFGLPLLAALFSVPFVVVLGIPAFILLRHINCVSPAPLSAVGFVAAAVPFGIFGWSECQGCSSGGNWYGTPVDFVLNGHRTYYGWLEYFQGIVFYGIHGLVGALAFLVAWRRIRALTTASSAT